MNDKIKKMKKEIELKEKGLVIISFISGALAMLCCLSIGIFIIDYRNLELPLKNCIGMVFFCLILLGVAFYLLLGSFRKIKEGI